MHSGTLIVMVPFKRKLIKENWKKILECFFHGWPQMAGYSLESAMVQCGAGMPVADADIKLASQSCWAGAGAGLTWAK